MRKKEITRRKCLGLLSAVGTGAMIPDFGYMQAVGKGIPRSFFQRNRPTLLLITGWATKNIGDIGHTPGILRYLEEHFPEAHVFCWLKAFNSEILSMLRRRFPKVELIEGGDLDENGKASTPELQTAFDNSDFVIQNSGMSYNRFWAPPVRWLKASLSKNKHFGLYAQSFDGMSDQDVETIPDLLSHIDFIFCRDNESLMFLRRAGIKTNILEFGPDACFGTDVRDEKSALNFINEYELEPRKLLVVILRSDDYRDRLNPQDPLNKIPGGPEEWSKKLREVIKYWISHTELPVVIAPEVEKEIKAAKMLLLEQLPDDIKKKVIHRKKFWNVDEAISFYERAHTVVSMEPHSCIMALSAGTPTIHFFTRHHGYKAWMFRDIGLPEWLISLDDESAERVNSELERIDNNYDLAIDKTRRAMKFVHSRSAEMITEIKQILNKE